MYPEAQPIVIDTIYDALKSAFMNGDIDDTGYFRAKNYVETYMLKV